MSLPLFDLGYWFSPVAAEVSGGIGQAIFVFFLLVFIMGLVARIHGPKRMPDRFAKRLVRNIGAALVIMGALGTVLFFLSSENIPFFGARFWYPAWLLCLAAWVGFYLWKAKKDIPVLREKQNVRKEMDAYLPKKK